MSYITANGQSGPARESAGGDWRSRVAPRVILSGVEARRTGRDLLRPSQRVFVQLSKSNTLPASESGRELSRRGGRASSLIGWQIFEGASTGLSASAAVTCTFLMAHRYDAEGSLNVSRVPTQTLRLLQSSLRDYSSYRLFPALRCASCRANYNRRSAAEHRRRTVRSSAELSHRL